MSSTYWHGRFAVEIADSTTVPEVQSALAAKFGEPADEALMSLGLEDFSDPGRVLSGVDGAPPNWDALNFLVEEGLLKSGTVTGFCDQNPEGVVVWLFDGSRTVHWNGADDIESAVAQMPTIGKFSRYSMGAHVPGAVPCALCGAVVGHCTHTPTVAP